MCLSLIPVSFTFLLFNNSGTEVCAPCPNLIENDIFLGGKKVLA